MKTKLLWVILWVVSPMLSLSQNYLQYFDGADTTSQSLQIKLDTSSTNIWQIGPPQKIIFNQAGTLPNVLITDTINSYPINNISSFTFGLASDFVDFGGVLAIQWKQKLDLDDTLDGGYIEFSSDSGATWTNAFNSPYTYNFYGFDNANKDTLVNGDVAFSGKDTNWRDIWLCFDYSWVSNFDSLIFKFTLKSDNIDNNREGWMIDNMNVHPTWFHTINEKEQDEYLLVYPNPTNGIVNIQAKKLKDYHIIKELSVVNIKGEIIQQHFNVPTKFKVDIRNQPSGIYFFTIKTNIQTETFRIVLQND